MKFLVVIAVFQCLAYIVRGSPAIVEPANSIQELLIEPNPEDVSATSHRSGRILATYGLNIKKNTADMLAKLVNVSTSVSSVSTEISSLAQNVNTTNTEILTSIDGIKTSLSSGGTIVTQLNSISTAMNNVLTTVTDSKTNGTLMNQLVTLYNLLETKLNEVEQILGYDDYPTTTAKPAGRKLWSRSMVRSVRLP